MHFYQTLPAKARIQRDMPRNWCLAPYSGKKKGFWLFGVTAAVMAFCMNFCWSIPTTSQERENRFFAEITDSWTQFRKKSLSTMPALFRMWLFLRIKLSLLWTHSRWYHGCQYNGTIFIDTAICGWENGDSFWFPWILQCSWQQRRDTVEVHQGCISQAELPNWTSPGIQFLWIR